MAAYVAVWRHIFQLAEIFILARFKTVFLFQDAFQPLEDEKVYWEIRSDALPITDLESGYLKHEYFSAWWVVGV